jgi:isopentenyl-diphosphate delta-isomerase
MLHNQTAQEVVVLVDDANTVLGTAPKATIHTDNTPLHRAFSCFCFRRDGKLLTQRRALHKVTWPGIWANSVCGHPGLNESNECAVYRRMRHELGITTASKMACMAPEFRYRAELDGVVEGKRRRVGGEREGAEGYEEGEGPRPNDQCPMSND